MGQGLPHGPRSRPWEVDWAGHPSQMDPVSHRSSRPKLVPFLGGQAVEATSWDCGERRDRRELREHLAGPAGPAGSSGPLPPDVLAVSAAALPAVEPQRGCSPAHPARPCGEPSNSGPVTKRSRSLLAGQHFPRPGW